MRPRSLGVAVDNEFPDIPMRTKRGLVNVHRDGYISDGRRLMVVTIEDDFTMESIVLMFDCRIPSAYVVRMLERAVRFRNVPKAICPDQELEFTGRHSIYWSM